MSQQCLAAIHICRLRVTRLDIQGNPVAGPNNVVVTDKPMQMTVTPVIEAGADRTLVGGCDCILATYKGDDKLKRFDLELDLGVLDPAIFEMLLNADAIVNGSAETVGVWWPILQFDCSTPQLPVAVEAWQTAWDGSGPASAHKNVHWIWPYTKWQIAPLTLQNDFNQPKITGSSQGNSSFGTGPFHDLPESVGPLGGWFFDDAALPTATCGYQSHAIT